MEHTKTCRGANVHGDAVWPMVPADLPHPCADLGQSPAPADALPLVADALLRRGESVRGGVDLVLSQPFGAGEASRRDVARIGTDGLHAVGGDIDLQAAERLADPAEGGVRGGDGAACSGVAPPGKTWRGPWLCLAGVLLSSPAAAADGGSDIDELQRRYAGE